jgi:hypothetical protein
MDKPRDNRILDLWLALANVPVDQWRNFLAQHCAADPSLIAEVLALERERAGQDSDIRSTRPSAFDRNLSLTPLTPGMVLHGRYRIVRPVGGGGMGTVHEAIDLHLRNIVAVKRMIAWGVEADRAFEREASLLASLRHPTLPVVLDYFIDVNGRFIVMQYIDGEDLSVVLERQGGPCSPHDVLLWALALLEVLDYLHSHVPPIVHRDIKPSNLRRTPRGELVLLDFGLAKGRTELSDHSARAEKSVFGFTPSYAPPEQLSGRGTTPQSDLYAVGATLYHLATGVVPPLARDRTEARVAGKPDPLVGADRINSTLTEAFADILTRALELDSAHRFSSANEMRCAFLVEGFHPAPSMKKPPVGERRVDAAIASQAEVGRQIDLIVQVRFADSPRLGLEDWPTRRRPAAIEQGSEDVRVAYPVDSRTGARIPARLRLKIVAPDFALEGDAERLIEVPPDDYSRRVAFLVSPVRPGYCRLNVEVYGPDALYLGAIPVEAEAVSTAALSWDLRVANLVLVLYSDEPAGPEAAPARAPAAADALLQRENRVRVTPPRSHRSTEPLSLAVAQPEEATYEGDDTQEILIARRKTGRLARGLGATFAVIVVIGISGISVWRAGHSGPNGIPTESPGSRSVENRSAAPQPTPSQTPSPGPRTPATVTERPLAPAVTAEQRARDGFPDSRAVEKGSPALQPTPSQTPGPKALFPSIVSDVPVAPALMAEASARNEIQQLVKNFCVAYETLKPESVQTLFPKVNPIALRDQFREYRTLKCTLTSPLKFERLDPGPAGGAEVKFGMKQVAVLRSDGTSKSVETIVTMVVSRTDLRSPWLIDEVRQDTGAGTRTLPRIDDRKLQLGKKRCEDANIAFSYGNNVEAAAAYQDVVKLLPPPDPCYALAKGRLKQLGK